MKNQEQKAKKDILVKKTGTKRDFIKDENDNWREIFVPIEILVLPPVTEQHEKIISC